MLKEGKIAIGTTITIGHPDIAEIIGHTGFDWVMLDTEHAPMNPAILQNLLQAMSFSRAVPIIRVAWNDMVLMKQALDIGAYGLIVPWVNTKEEAARAVQSIKYPPTGLRGFGPRRAGLGDPEYVTTANQEVMLCVQIETQRGIENIDDILSVEGVDAALVGPADLSLSMGILYQYEHPKFAAAMQKIADSAKSHGVIAGMLATDDARKRINQGFTMINISADFMLLREATKKILETADEIRGSRK